MQTEDISQEFVNKWISGGSGHTSTIPGLISPPDVYNTNTATTTTTTTGNSSARDKLVKELTHKVEQESNNEEATFTLTIGEMRLLLGLVVAPTTKQKIQKNRDISCGSHDTALSSVEGTPLSLDPVRTFRSWDITSFFDEDLEPEETQAVMIALAAEEEEQREQLLLAKQQQQQQAGVGSAAVVALPPLPSSLGARQITLQKTRSSGAFDEDIEYLVTLFSNNSDININETDIATPPPPPPPSRDPPKRPNQIVTRQVSIQQQQEPQSPPRSPNNLCRQASVRPVFHDDNDGGGDDGLHKTQFVVTFPNNTTNNNNHKGGGGNSGSEDPATNKEVSNNNNNNNNKPSTVVRQLSAKPTPIPESDKETFRTTTTSSGAGMRVSLNGSKNMSFQVVF